MAEIKILPRERAQSWQMATGDWHKLIIHRFRAALVEMEDVHFHWDSAVMMPDRDPADAVDDRSGSALTSLSVIRACYLHAGEHPDQHLLCAGHTDRGGPPAYNQNLSHLRARSVRAVMSGDADGWAALCADKHVVRDYQLILKWTANVRYWPDCDPGAVDGRHGTSTSRSLRAFKKRYNAELGGSLADNATVDKPTWKAFFRMYMLGLAGVMQTDEAGLDKHRSALHWHSPDGVGCGEHHPVTPDVAASYKSAVDRRVELLFFEPGHEPDLGPCHPSAKECVPESCDLYRAGLYVFKPIVIGTNAKVALRLGEVRGLYKPGHNDPADLSAGKAKLSGYLKGYKGEDDQGRIFINQIPRVDPSVDWEAVKKKDQQFIELQATIDVAEGTLPPDSQVVWQWSNPGDPSDTSMRDDAAEDIDPNDFAGGKRIGETGDDNAGFCDFPSPKSGKQPAFEQIAPYTLTPDAAGTRRCFTLISGGKSEVRFHCTDAGGDNFRLQATVRPAPGLVVTAGDRTGLLSMWKRIDVEHRRMPDAESIPAKDLAPFFEKQFVQMDVGDEQLTSSNPRYISTTDNKKDFSAFVDKEFRNKKKPGWFFICVAREAAAPVGKPRHSLFEGPAKLVVEGPGAPTPPGSCEPFHDRLLPHWETVVIDAVLTEPAFLVALFEGGKRIPFFALETNPDVAKGQTRIRLTAIDFQSDFDSADGSIKKAHEKTNLYFPRFRYRWPDNIWEKRGYGFPDNVYVNVLSEGASVTGGISPGIKGPGGCDFFAGRTIIFCRHPAYTRPSSAKIEVIGKWGAGEVAEVTIAGTKVSYTVTARDVTVPAGVADADLFMHGQVARGIEVAINAHPVVSRTAIADAAFGFVRVKATAVGAAGDGTLIAVKPDIAAATSGVLKLSSGTLKDGGFTDEAKRDIVKTFTHELGHAFGFPHKCGYNTFENPAGTSCTMNYPNTWLYKLGTHRDPVAREVIRFEVGKNGNHFCARHTRGIRLGQLEANPVLWSW